MSNLQQTQVSHELCATKPAIKKIKIRPRCVETKPAREINWREDVQVPVFRHLPSLLTVHGIKGAKLCMKVHDYYSSTTQEEQRLLWDMESIIANERKLWSRADFLQMIDDYGFHFCYEGVKSSSTLLVAPDRSVPKCATIEIDDDYYFPSYVCAEAEVIEDSPIEQAKITYDESDFAHEDYFYMSRGVPYSTLKDVPIGQLATKVSCLVGGNPGKKKKKRGGKRKKRTKKRQTLVQGQQLGLRNPRDMTTYPPKIMDLWRYEQIIETDGTGSFSVYCNLRDPQKAINGSGTYERAIGFANLYDEFKPIEIVAVLDFLQLNVNNGYTRIAVDYDSIPTGTYLPSDLRDNEYMREYSGTNQMAYSAKVVPLSEGTFNGRSSIIHQRGWYDFNSPPEEGGLIIAGERYVPSNRMLNLVLTVRVLLRRRRTIAAARDERLQSQKELLDLEKKLKRMST